MATPHFKLESPAESLQHDFSDSNQVYSPLFADEGMSPPSQWDVDSASGSIMGESPGPESQKKPVKKRKSWGQQLPEPKTNLPPRKRAKTEDEKEQRRVERVLRNRRAAQSSRERKRQEVEALEEQKRDIERRNQQLEQQLAEARSHDAVQRRNQELEKMLEEANARMVLMQQQLEAATGGNMMVFHGTSASSPAHTEQFRSAPSPVTLSQELFSSRDAPERSSISSSITHETPIATQTVNPASLSPRTNPTLEESSASAFDLTQQPAVSIDSASTLDNFSYLSNPSYDMRSLMDFPESTDANLGQFTNGLLPPNESFDFNYDNMVNDNHFAFDDNNIFESFINHDEHNQPSQSEVQSADPLAEQAAFLQPPIGASSLGCDAGGNAVSV